jgi:hypothetical protein
MIPSNAPKFHPDVNYKSPSQANKENIPPLKVSSSTIKSGTPPIPPQLEVSTAIGGVERKRAQKKTKDLQTEKVATVEKKAVKVKVQIQKVLPSEAINKLFKIDGIPDLPESNIEVKYPGSDKTTILTPEMCKQMYLQQQSVKLKLIQDSKIKGFEIQLLELSEKIPFIKEAVNAARHSFEKLDELHYDGDLAGANLKKIEITKQLDNLHELIGVLDEIKDEIALEQLSIMQNKDLNLYQKTKDKKWVISENNQIVPDVILSGFLSINEALKLNIKERIEDRMNSELKKTSEPIRPKRTITKDAIELQAVLHQVMRGSKAWAREQKELKRFGKSANKVFKLSNAIGETASKHSDAAPKAAFFKIGSDEDRAVGAMETLMWKLAVLFNLEKQFVPTGETTVYTGSGAAKAVMEWNRQGELTKLDSPSEPMRGGIQPGQEGETLKDYLANEGQKPIIKREEIVSAFLSSMVFGMFDAHGGNIFITEQGKIKYFDNSRSMPNANGYIRNDIRYVPSYRSGLMELKDMYQSLSKEEREQLKIKVAEYKEKIVELKDYLNTRDAKGLIKKLPPGWLDQEGAINGVISRLDLLEKALDNKNVQSLCDLVMESIPGYKLTFALCATKILADHCGSKAQGPLRMDLIQNPRKLSELQASLHIHTWVGYFSNVDLIKALASGDIDVAQINALVENPKLKPHEIMKGILELFNDLTTRQPLSPDQKSKVALNANNLISSIVESAVVDNKDLSRDLSVIIMKQEKVQNKIEELSKQISPTILSEIEKFIYILQENYVLDSDKNLEIVANKEAAIQHFENYRSNLPSAERDVMDQLYQEIQTSMAIPPNPSKKQAKVGTAEYLFNATMNLIKDVKDLRAAIILQNQIQEMIAETAKQISPATLSELEKLISILQEDHWQDPDNSLQIIAKKEEALLHFEAYERTLPAPERHAMELLNKEIQTSKMIPLNPSKKAGKVDRLVDTAMQYITYNKDLKNLRAAIMQQNPVQEKIEALSRQISSATLSELENLLPILRENHPIEKKREAIAQFQAYRNTLSPQERRAMNLLYKEVQISKAIPPNPSKKAIKVAEYVDKVLQAIIDFEIIHAGI